MAEDHGKRICSDACSVKSVEQGLSQRQPRAEAAKTVQEAN